MMLLRSVLILLLFALLCEVINGIVTTNCPNSCSGHGYCTNSPHSHCECYPGYVGGDCSQRVCPAARAWVDYPTGNSTAHAQFTECSNMGLCDRSTGICSCRPGFGGDACDIMLCPMALNPNSLNDYSTNRFPCSSNGRCMSLRDASEYNNLLGFASNEPYDGWDADMIHGCVCDKGWEGAACELRSCPKGDDPLTDGVDDIQLIDCKCTSCQGGFYLTFHDQQTPLISFNASAELIQYRLSQLSNFDYVDVSQVMGPAVCSDTGSITQITFRALTTLKSAIKMTTAYGLDGHVLGIVAHGAISRLDLVRSRDGTREYATCSNRGDCDFATGVCSCYGGFVDSDGAGGPGTIGDCGYRLYYPFNHTVYTTTTIHNGTYTYTNATRITTNCPFAFGAICGGNGTCSEATGMCSCFDGYSGSACTNITCATTFSWFGDIDSQHRGASICSGVGECDGHTGLCVNCGGASKLFTGDRCEYLSCYSDGKHECSGNGACMTLKQMATFAYNEQKELAGTVYEDAWDAEHIRGCSCYRAISVDNQYDPNYYQVIDAHSFNYTTNKTEYFSAFDLEKFYRGPYAYAATNFQGYNCMNAQCPKGDNPRSRGVNEIQVIHCRANNGTFKLTFRENTTLPISYNATAAELEFALEQIYTISDVSVTLVGGEPRDAVHNHSVCNLFNNISVYIEFLTEFGDLPMLIPDVTLIDSYAYGLDDYRNTYIMNVTEYQKGTKYDLECSALGTCDETTGQCKCFEGFSSSDGSTSAPGDRGDCAFVNKFYTEKYV